MILSAQGATMAESWTSSSMMLKDPDFQSASVKLQSYSPETFKSEKTDSIIKLLGGRFPLKDSGMQQGNALYAQPTWDDNNWMNIEVPGFWENKGYPGIDGVAWYRRTVKLSSVKREAVTLHLGRVSNKEQVWINGVALKGEGSQVSRVYHIPVNVLKNGENQITVRIVNNQGGGGFGASYDSMYIKTSSRQEYIGGIWKFNVSEIFESCLRFESLGPNDFPSLLYNAMINPIIRYGIKGVIWYQGEHNTDRAKQYKRLFPNLILDWRLKWQLADLPFLFVSLPNYRKECQRPCESKWAELREAQTAALKLPNTGMAVAIDLGEADNLHPPNKQPIGYRLALNALRLAYQKDIVHVSPMFKSMQILENKIVLNFDHIGSGLVANDGSEMLKRFSIAGADRRFFWAKARIIGSNQVEVFASEVRKPVAVRYGWADNPGAVNFYNHEQLPVNSFRTDTWYRN